MVKPSVFRAPDWYTRLGRRSAPAWIHALLWPASFFSFATTVSFGLILIRLSAAPTEKAAQMWAESWLMFGGSAVAFLALVAVWPLFLFLPCDLTKLIADFHGTGRWRDQNFSGRVKQLRLSASLDRPFGDYRTAPWFRKRKNGDGTAALVKTGSFDPRYMHRMSRVDLFWPAQLGRVSETEIVVAVKGGLPEVTGPINDAFSDRAIRQASECLTSEGMELRLRFDPRYLRVRIIGGTWLGRAFGERIEQGIAFTERLTDRLETRYKALDVAGMELNEEPHEPPY